MSKRRYWPFLHCTSHIGKVQLSFGHPQPPRVRAPGSCGCQPGPTGVSSWSGCHEDRTPASAVLLLCCCCAVAVLESCTGSSERASVQILQHLPRPHSRCGCKDKAHPEDSHLQLVLLFRKGSSCHPIVRLDVWCLDNTLSHRRRSLALTRHSLDLHTRRTCSLIQREHVARHFGVTSSTDPGVHGCLNVLEDDLLQRLFDHLLDQLGQSSMRGPVSSRLEYPA